ncbi:MAG: phosphoribosyl-AMP cyclohydrolase [Gammaproteobacteria bacterium]|nr:phosphoribosyl-AMP cyclohydrolase [Gammaproteobacteria bacterium]MCI0590498.1 phosphoribosyl-AMP cyclohydrolase [Gammaproteobacteria bacterium]
MDGIPDAPWLDEVRWDNEGLVPVVAQEIDTGKVLMVAWMNRLALYRTVTEGRAVYWSRSRGCLWQKGEQSGHFQDVAEVRLDCDKDVILLAVKQMGAIACHTGRHHCFFYRLEGNHWVVVEPVIKDPAEIYGN